MKSLILVLPRAVALVIALSAGSLAQAAGSSKPAAAPSKPSAPSKPAAAVAAATPKLETAGFAAGCFWGTEEFFRKMPGVVSTQAGYEGGDKIATYEDVSTGTTGHAETVQVKYDPKVVSFEHLLDQFFKMHDPTTMNRQGNDNGPQYRSEIFTSTPEQKAEAMAFKEKVEKSRAWKAPIVTKIEMAKTFYPAEEYHQKYLVKNPGGYDNHHLRDISFDSAKK